MTIKPPPCPACKGPMHQTPAHNSTSRFVSGLYICSACGVREALEGDWWGSSCDVSSYLMHKSQAAWIKSEEAKI